MIDGLGKKETLNGVMQVGSNSNYIAPKQTSTNQNSNQMNNTTVSRAIETITFSWTIDELAADDSNGANVTLGFSNVIGNSVVAGALPSGFEPASVTGVFNANMLRELLRFQRAKIVQFNYECKQDENQLNEPISFDEAVQASSSNVAYIETAPDRRNSENVSTLQTIFKTVELNAFRSIKINAPRLPNGQGSKTVNLTIKIESWHGYGDVVPMGKTCK